MKILVDKMPTYPDECIFNKMYLDTRASGCVLGDHRNKCGIGSKGFKCPHLQEFKAIGKEQIGLDSNTYRITPVELVKED